MKCKSCGAEIKFNPDSQKLVCEHCGTSYSVDDLNDESTKANADFENTTNTKSYTCSNCGATLLTFDDTAVTFCSYCGSSMVIEPQLYKGRKPDYIIPFKITKEECENIYRKYVNKFPFAPNYLKDNYTISKFRGIYMPYGMYSAEHHGVQYNTGDKYSYRTRNYRYYKQYAILANIDASYDGIPFDLSSQFQDSFSQAISPFDMSEAVPFDDKYISGYYADRADVVEKTYADDIKETVKSIVEKDFKKVRSFRKYGCLSPELTLNVINKKAVYYPVYFLAIKSSNNTISYAVINGQNGKIAVEMPIDYKKYFIFSLLLSIPIFILLNYKLELTLVPNSVATITLLWSIINLYIFRVQNTKIHNKYKRTDDKGYWSNKNLKEVDENVHAPSCIKIVLGIIISVAVLLINPVQDLYYYGASILAMIMVLMSVFDLVKQYNLLAGRKLSQLGKRGGDENE